MEERKRNTIMIAVALAYWIVYPVVLVFFPSLDGHAALRLIAFIHWTMVGALGLVVLFMVVLLKRNCTSIDNPGLTVELPEKP